MKEEYKGYLIEYGETSNVWTIRTKDDDVDGDDEVGSRPSLIEARKFVDKIIKQKFKPVPVLVRGRWDTSPDYEPGTLTTIFPNGEYRISLKNREWLKTGHAPILDIPENQQLLRAIKDRRNQIKKLEKNISQIERTLKRYKRPGKGDK